MTQRPTLIVFVDGRTVARVTPPAEIAPRAWRLGVVAVQVAATGGAVSAVVRANETGRAEPAVVQLPPRARVDVALAVPGRPAPALPRLPELARPALSLSVDGVPAGRAALDAPADGRAFGHVYCRWLRAGGSECGCDLTRLQPWRQGVKHPRVASRPVRPPAVVTYQIALPG
ncbi:MAG: hypothetical protein D6689_19220 [Deltaproteobacteria bacterium]|nr:MAG: hypothetical protein D6689_19220 [Deltaproteobacteria bacterium]